MGNLFSCVNQQKLQIVKTKASSTTNDNVLNLIINFWANNIYGWNNDLTNIVLLYSKLYDEWDINNTSKSFKISGMHNQILTQIKHQRYNSAFLTNIIEYGYHHWTFQITKSYPDAWGISMGIVPLNKVSSYINARFGGYGIACHSKNIVAMKAYPVVGRSGKNLHSRCLKNGDILEFILDFTKNSFVVKLNNKNFGNIILKNEKIKKVKYKFGINSWRDHIIQLIDYNHKF